jgi:hypothetical protein
MLKYSVADEVSGCWWLGNDPYFTTLVFCTWHWQAGKALEGSHVRVRIRVRGCDLRELSHSIDSRLDTQGPSPHQILKFLRGSNVI